MRVSSQPVTPAVGLLDGHGHCEGCGISLTEMDGGGPDCLECRSLAQLSVEELGEPVRTATVRRLDEMLATLRSHVLGDQGVELADLILCLREAVGEAADPFLGAFHDGRAPELPMAQRSGDIARRVVAVLEGLLGESPAARCRLGTELSSDELCARAGMGFVMADRALARAGDVATRDPRAAIAQLVPAHAGAVALRICLAHLERCCDETPSGTAESGSTVRACAMCATPFGVVRRRGRQPARLCPPCRLREVLGDADGEGRRLHELAGALRGARRRGHRRRRRRGLALPGHRRPLRAGGCGRASRAVPAGWHLAVLSPRAIGLGSPTPDLPAGPKK
jgi:hypothetical protein